MKSCQCSQCGASADGLVWGFALLVRNGWGVAAATNPPGAAERAWLCPACELRATSLARRWAKPGTAPLPSRALDAPPLKVLVVDDHVLILRGMLRLLDGCATTVRSSAVEALALLDSGASFDVIISDVMMPGMSGPEFYEQCFERSPELAQRFVFASADLLSALPMVEAAAARTGADPAPPLLGKPTAQEALLLAINQVASNAVHRSGTHLVRLPGGLASENR